jgi:membrane-bound lytic murein transglycosylase B
MKRLALLLLACALCGTAGAEPPATPVVSLARPEVQGFIREMVERHGFDPAALRDLFAKARFLPEVVQIMQPSGEEAPSWEDYRASFVGERRIDEGLEFWDSNRATLARAERVYGVPAAVIVAIIGIESAYGRHTGRWRVLDTLSTLAFVSARRAEFFRGELESYLLLARESGLDARTLRGSSAGAIGLPQFMPRTYREYAVDFDGDGKADLLDSSADAIGSVANFLRAHGWSIGDPVDLDASVSGAGYRAFVDRGARPRYTLAELARAGVEFADTGLPVDARAALLELSTPDEPSEYRLGLNNFYVITRYNRSVFYAAAVSDLAKALLAAGRP